MKVAVVINPVSGVRRGTNRARQRAHLAVEVISRLGHEPDVLVTERAGHAVELAASAVARGAAVVCAWGGDGTMNEVGRAVAFTPAALALIPSGSGNGLARALGVPWDPRLALHTAVSGTNHRIDAGEIAGRLFFNVAGLGFDAHVARAFARNAGARGLRRYVTIVARELFTYVPPDLELGDTAAHTTCHAFLLTIANGPQFGNGAVVAPDARLDDGLLDLVVVELASRLRLLRAVPSLFTRGIARQPGVRISQVAEVRVIGHGPLIFHVDGEAFEHEGDELVASVRPGALLVRH